MGTIERGESNLSFLNIAKVATALGVTLSTLFLDLEGRARTLVAKPPATPGKSKIGGRVAKATSATGR
jgi:hypothetical protein